MEFFASEEGKTKKLIKGLPQSNPGNVVENALSAVYAFAGVIAVVFVIISGISMMTSSGDPGKIAKAKNTLIFAIVGLIIVVLASAITYFVMKGVK